MKTEQQAVELARLMVEIGAGLGRRTRAVISDMSQPLGLAVGNAVELREAIDTLHGGGPADLRLHCLTIVAEMLRVAGQDSDRPSTLQRLEGLLDGGEAWETFCAWIAAQGGDLRVVQDPERLPKAALVRELGSPRGGFLAAIRADEVGMASMLLGGGRARKEDGVDHAVGVVLRAKVGDYVESDEPLLTVHANDEGRLAEATERLLAAYAWSDEPVTAPTLMHQIIA
jgi:pyrimidine-nucleoside phosphorylase